MGLLNSGTLNRGRNLCVTVAVDHSTVDGFHGIMTAVCGKIQDLLSKKGIAKAKGASTNQLSQSILFGSLIDYHSNSVFTFLEFLHQFGNTALPGTLLEYVWYEGRGGANLERNPYGSRP